MFPGGCDLFSFPVLEALKIACLSGWSPEGLSLPWRGRTWMILKVLPTLRSVSLRGQALQLCGCVEGEEPCGAQGCHNHREALGLQQDQSLLPPAGQEGRQLPAPLSSARGCWCPAGMKPLLARTIPSLSVVLGCRRQGWGKGRATNSPQLAHGGVHTVMHEWKARFCCFLKEHPLKKHLPSPGLPRARTSW